MFVILTLALIGLLTPSAWGQDASCEVKLLQSTLHARHLTTHRQQLEHQLAQAQARVMILEQQLKQPPTKPDAPVPTP